MIEMPRLSVTLTGPRHPHRCSRCGAFWADKSAWQEHDEFDRPEPIAIVLCDDCAKKVIEKHPRLYRQLDNNEPFPGTMRVCVDCRHRDGLRCTSLEAKFNGGPGLKYDIAEPTRVHFCRVPRSQSGWTTIWPEPAKGCSGREVAGE